jgi:hypothetical protein
VGVDNQIEDSAIIAIPQISQQFNNLLVLYLQGVVKDNKGSELHIFLQNLPIYLFELLCSMLQYFALSCTDGFLLKALEQQTLNLFPLLNKALSKRCIDGHSVLILRANVFQEVVGVYLDVELCEDVLQLFLIEESPRTDSFLILEVLVDEPPDTMSRPMDCNDSAFKRFLVLEVVLKELEYHSQKGRFIFFLIKISHRDVQNDGEKGLISPPIFEHV